MHYQSTVNMISFAQVRTAQWSNTIPCWNVWFTVRIHLTLFRFNSQDSLHAKPRIAFSVPWPRASLSTQRASKALQASIRQPKPYWTPQFPTMLFADKPPHQIRSYTLLFLLFLRFLYIVDPPLCTSAPMQLHAITLAQQSHSLHKTNLAYLMDTWLTIHMYLLLFLVSPTCPLLQSNQSRALAPHSQALSITSPYAHILVYHLYLTCLYLPFAGNIITEEPHTCLYQFPSELRFSTYTLHCLALISHYFASHSTATIPLSLLATLHLETIPYPDRTPSEPHRIYT